MVNRCFAVLIGDWLIMQSVANWLIQSKCVVVQCTRQENPENTKEKKNMHRKCAWLYNSGNCEI